MRRLLGLAVVTLLCVASSPTQAQQARRPFKIGVLNAAWAASHPTVEGLKAGLRELGFEDGRDVTFDIRFTAGKLDAMPAAAESAPEASGIRVWLPFRSEVRRPTASPWRPGGEAS